MSLYFLARLIFMSVLRRSDARMRSKAAGLPKRRVRLCDINTEAVQYDQLSNLIRHTENVMYT